MMHHTTPLCSLYLNRNLNRKIFTELDADEQNRKENMQSEGWKQKGVTGIKIKESQQTDMEPIDFHVNPKYSGAN